MYRFLSSKRKLFRLSDCSCLCHACRTHTLSKGAYPSRQTCTTTCAKSSALVPPCSSLQNAAAVLCILHSCAFIRLVSKPAMHFQVPSPQLSLHYVQACRLYLLVPSMSHSYALVWLGIQAGEFALPSPPQLSFHVVQACRLQLLLPCVPAS